MFEAFEVAMAKDGVQLVEEQEEEGEGDWVAGHGEKPAADYQAEAGERERMQGVFDMRSACED